MERYTYKRMHQVGYGLLRLEKECEAIDRLGIYEYTGLTPDQVQKFADVDSRMKQVLGNAITVSEIIQQFLDFYEARSDESRVEDAVLLTNEEAGKWKELQERDTAKRPYYEGDGYDNKGEMIYDTWRCPNCDAGYEVDYDNYDFCPNCGQRLKWED